MKFVRLGRTGLQVSRVCLGTMTLTASYRQGDAPR
jgi:aryl-alcohol dehydrogenase-like predicted oxidoreductase